MIVFEHGCKANGRQLATLLMEVRELEIELAADGTPAPDLSVRSCGSGGDALAVGMRDRDLPLVGIDARGRIIGAVAIDLDGDGS